jgi:hypothetical protein
MTRYFFHLKTADELVRDEEGNECRDLAAARRQALAIAREILILAIKGSEGELIVEAIAIENGDSQSTTFVPLTEVLPPNLRARFR